MVGPHDHPEVTMRKYPLAEYMRHVDANDLREAGRLLLSSANILAAAGAELWICADNTLHQALDLVPDESPVRWLHIAEEVAAATARNVKRPAIRERAT